MLMMRKACAKNMRLNLTEGAIDKVRLQELVSKRSLGHPVASQQSKTNHHPAGWLLQ